MSEEVNSASSFVEQIIPVGSLILGLIGGYFATFLSDNRKSKVENKKELRLAYARWYSQQRMAFHPIALLFNSMLVDSRVSLSEGLRQYADIQKELKEFQSMLLILLQVVAEVSLLEAKEDRLKKIESLDVNLNKFYHLLLETSRGRKAQVEQLTRTDELVISTVKKRPDSNIGEELEGIRARHREPQEKAFLEFQTSVKSLTELMNEVDIEIKEFFYSLKGKL
jgi:hypothetical protein